MSLASPTLVRPILQVESKFLSIPSEFSFEGVVTELRGNGFEPLINKAKEKIFELFGLIPLRPEPTKSGLKFYGGSIAVSNPERRLFEGDICLSDQGNTVFYCGTFFSAEEKGMILEVGAIGDSGQLDGFSRFSGAVENSLRTAGIPCKWHTVVYNSPTFIELQKSTEIKFLVGNQVSAEDLSLAAVLEDNRLRGLALLIKSSGGILLPDLLKKGGLEPHEVNAMLEPLTKAALVNREHVIICKKSLNQINRVNSMESLTKLLELDVRCSCGGPISQERIEDLYTPTPKLQKMLDQSFWMSVWLVRTLIATGICSDRIILNLHEGPEEIDAFVDARGKLALFELKDREFSMGDAYPFGARVALYKPDYAFIVSSRGIAPEVRDHFKKMKLSCELLYVDKLPQFQPTVEELLAQLHRKEAVQVLSQFNRLRNIEIPFSEIFGKRLGVTEIKPEKSGLSDVIYRYYDTWFTDKS